MEIMATNLKAINTNDEDVIKDGEKITNLNYKDLGTSDIYPLVLFPFIHHMSKGDQT